MKQELDKAGGKLEPIQDDDFRTVQEYFSDKSVESVRMGFKVRSQMVPEIPGNFKNKYKHEGLNRKYCYKEEIMTQSHCLVWPAWAELRRGPDIRDLVKFFRKLLDERAKIDVWQADSIARLLFFLPGQGGLEVPIF